MRRVMFLAKEQLALDQARRHTNGPCKLHSDKKRDMTQASLVGFTMVLENIRMVIR